MTLTQQCALHWTFLSSVRSANAEILTQEETISAESGILNNLAKVKVEQIDEYSTETTYVDGTKQITSLDFSEATFYDEEGNEQDRLLYTNTRGIITGGTNSSGSGYSCVKGVKLLNKIVGMYKFTFKANYCNHKDAYDSLEKVYATAVEAGESVDILKEGVMRRNEKLGYSAYGGIKALVKASPSSKMTTEHLYLRVGKDKAWHDTSF